MSRLTSRKTIAITLLAMTLAAATAVPATARQHHRRAAAGVAWSRETLPSSLGALSGLSCLGAGRSAHCVAVGWTRSGAGAAVVSRDAGATWKLSSLPTGVGRLAGVACSSASDCWADGLTAAGAGAVISTTDGGSRWRLDARPPQGPYFHGLGQISCVGQRCWINEVYANDVLFTPDGGRHWSQQVLTVPCAGGCIGFLSSDVTFVNARVGYATGLSQCGGYGATQCPGVVWHTTDGGSHWRVLRSSLRLPAADAISCIGTSHCWVATATFKTAEVYGTASGGARWRRQRLPALGGFFNDMHCKRSARADRCFAVGQNERGTAALIAQTTNGGYRWFRDRTPHLIGPLGEVSFVGSTGRTVGENSTATAAVALRS